VGALLTGAMLTGCSPQGNAPANSSAGLPVQSGNGGAVSTVVPSQNAADYIGEEKAKAIALEHAGLSGEGVTFVHVELDFDDGRFEYEVEFWSGNVEYDYTIDALTGEIRAYDHDAEYYAAPAQSAGQTPAQSSAQYIGEEQAKAIALAHAGIAADNARFTEIKLDFDDGRYEYEIEFWSGNYEYSYDIDAVTGDIIGFDVDRD
ncbi:MAG: PepSY domain-containing protein, partial [Oscillospiraceae bacterium]